MLPESKWRQFGLPDATIEGIVIHNTNSTKSASQLEEMMLNDESSSRGTHFFVDDQEVVQVMPTDWSVWNTGMGYDFGNLHCIAIEIVSSLSDRKYLEGQSRAIELIEQLMEQFHLKKKDIYFHRDFQPNINCPAQILKLYGNKANFLSLITESEVNDEQATENIL